MQGIRACVHDDKGIWASCDGAVPRLFIHLRWFKSSGDGGLLANPDGVGQLNTLACKGCYCLRIQPLFTIVVSWTLFFVQGWVVTLNAENLTAGYHYRHGAYCKNCSIITCCQ